VGIASACTPRGGKAQVELTSSVSRLRACEDAYRGLGRFVQRVRQCARCPESGAARSAARSLVGRPRHRSQPWAQQYRARSDATRWPRTGRRARCSTLVAAAACCPARHGCRRYARRLREQYLAHVRRAARGSGGERLPQSHSCTLPGTFCVRSSLSRVTLARRAFVVLCVCTRAAFSHVRALYALQRRSRVHAGAAGVLAVGCVCAGRQPAVCHTTVSVARVHRHSVRCTAADCSPCHRTSTKHRHSPGLASGTHARSPPCWPRPASNCGTAIC
jgi:hypothetical protein